MINKKVVLFGAGRRGRNYLQQLRNEDIDVNHFCDNSESLWGTYLDGIEIRKPTYDALADCYVIIAVKEDMGIKEQLLECGVEVANILDMETLEKKNKLFITEISNSNNSRVCKNEYCEDAQISIVYLGDFPYASSVKQLKEVCSDYKLEIIVNPKSKLTEMCHADKAIILAHDDYVQPKFIENLIRTYEENDCKCVVGSKVVDFEQKIISAGQIYWSDGIAENMYFGQKMSICETEFVREVNGLIIDGILVGRKQFDLFDRFCDKNDYYGFFCELKHQGIPAIYQPESVVMKNSQNTPQYAQISEYNIMPEYFETNSESCVNGRNISLRKMSAKKYKGYMVLVEGTVPRYDQTAAGRTVDQYIEIFQKIGWQVVLLPSNYLKTYQYTQRYQQKGIWVIYGVEWHRERQERFKQLLDDVSYVFCVWPHCSLEYLNIIKEYKPSVTTSYYGGDIHYVRLQRQYELTNDEKYLEESKIFRKWEEEIVDTVDFAGFPSFLEVDYLKQQFPDKNIQYYPAFYYPTKKLTKRKKENSGLIFCGIFAHAPNTDGMLWFLQKVLPILNGFGFKDKVYVVGGLPTEELVAHGNEQVIVTGHVTDEELTAYYENARIAIAPLRFGAGIKGKILEAMNKGIPMVTTDVGAESIKVEEAGLTIANEEVEFAKAIWELYNNQAEIERKSEMGQNYTMKYFGEEALKGLFESQMAYEKHIPKLVLYGAGIRGKRMLEQLKHEGEKVYYFVDKDSNKIGTYISGVPVISIEELKQVKDHRIIITPANSEGIKDELLANGIKEKNILSAFSRTAYKWIDAKYAETAMKRYTENAEKTILFDCENGICLGGVESWCLDIGAGLDEKGYRVKYIAKRLPIRLPDKLEKQMEYVRIRSSHMFEEQAVIDMIEVIAKNLPCTVVACMPDEVMVAACAVKEVAPDKVNIISAIHNDISDFYEKNIALDHYIDSYICVSKKIQDIMKSRVDRPEKVLRKVSPIKHEEKLERTYNLKEKLCIGLAGRIEIQQKRLDLLIPLVIKLKLLNVNFVLELAGDGTYLEEIRKEVERFGLQKDVHICGRIDNDKMHQFWLRQDVSVNLSDYEGRSLSVMEAMSAGAVPVLTDTSGNEDIIEGINGYLVPLEDIDMMAQRISYLDGHREFLPKMGQRAHEVIVRECNREEYVDFVEKLL